MTICNLVFNEGWQSDICNAVTNFNLTVSMWVLTKPVYFSFSSLKNMYEER